MNISDTFGSLNDFSPEDLKELPSAPLVVRIIAIVVASIVLVIGYWYFMVKPNNERIEGLVRQESTLRGDYDDAAAKAANLDAYKMQLEEMRHDFAVMLRQLPDNIDIESLLVDLSQTSVAAGLNVEYFRPQGEVQQEFYAEYPIQLRVAGTYHEFGNFVSGLSTLPRIVTLSNIDIQGDIEGTGVLTMDLTATTYRYLAEDES